MRNRLIAICVLTLGLVLFLAGPALASPPTGSGAKSGPAVYISTAGGKQILAVDGETGNTVIIHNGSSGFSPEDIVVGPDKRIYICDPIGGKIIRITQNDGEIDVVYDQSLAPPEQNPTQPEGPSFSGNDLYFNTAGSEDPPTGVWVITGAAGVVHNGSFNAPTHLFTTGATGEGTAFGTVGDTSGKLLIVENSSNQVLSCNPSSCGSPTVLIQNPDPCGGVEQPPCVLGSPVGIAVNSAGHIFVANRGTLKNVNEFDSSGNFVGTGPYATFSGDSPYFLEFDAFDRLFVVTAAGDFTGGKVWRVDPGTTPTVNQLPLTTGGSLLTTDAVGLGLAPNAFDKKTYTTAVGGATNTFSFVDPSTSQLTDQVVITFLGSVNDTFDLIVFREEIPPALLATQLTKPLFSGDTCSGYTADPGTCVVYEILGVASAGPPPVPMNPPSQSSTTFTGNIQFQVFYNASASDTKNPVLAHARDDMVDTAGTGVDQYDEDIISDFSGALGPINPDPGMSGGSGGFSRLAPLNKPLSTFQNQSATFCGFNSPIPPGKTFLVGQTVPVKFQLAANCTNGSFITKAKMHLSVSKDGGGFQVVQSANTRDKTNLFSVAGKQYIFNLSTLSSLGYTPGKYFVTIWGDAVSPRTTFFFLQ